MATVALALATRGKTDYREVDHGDYARATGEAVATFPVAAAAWGVIRAYARDGGDWVPLASPVFVGRGQRATFDVTAATLAVSPTELPAGSTEGRQLGGGVTRAIDRGQ